MDRDKGDTSRDEVPQGHEGYYSAKNHDTNAPKPIHMETVKPMTSKSVCDVCGLKNHTTEECRKKLFCELCGFANHTTLDCNREPFWNVGPELCAAQVHKQGFFFIDESIDPKASKDKASTAIITVVRGNLTAKMIENEFTRLVSSAHWKWTARQIAADKYTMRFPTPKMVMDYINFTLGIKNVDAQFTVEPWTSAISSKGQLQQAWFRVRGIPVDQRGLRTIAKIGGLVGKTMAIDEGTRFSKDFVRVKIACRNIDLVPSSAEST